MSEQKFVDPTQLFNEPFTVIIDGEGGIGRDAVAVVIAEQAKAENSRLRASLSELVEAGNALSGDIAELIGIHGVEESPESWEGPIERAVYGRQRDWLDLAAAADLLTKQAPSQECP